MDESAERRRRPHPESAMGYLEALPATVLLERLPVPVLAVHVDGTLLYANGAFEQLVGCDRSELVGKPIGGLFIGSDAETSPFGLLRASVGQIVQLTHAVDGTIIRALVGESAFIRDDDPVVMVSFLDVTEELWNHGGLPGPAHPA